MNWLDVVKQEKCMSDTGDSAREFFNNSSISAEIAGVDKHIIEQSDMILKTIASVE